MDNVTKIGLAQAPEALPSASDYKTQKAGPWEWPESTQSEFSIQVEKTAGKPDRYGLYASSDDGPELVSGGIWVKGQARDGESRGWCNVIDFIDMDNKQRQWLMPRALLAGDKTEAIRELLERGFFIVSSTDAKKNVFRYISHGRSDKYITVDRTGWQDGCFVLPDQVIGNKRFMLANSKPSAITKAGTLKSWRESIAAACVGNSRLLLGVSGAFASPLLDIAGVEGGALHFVGGSSQGKTKILRAASTVFGVTVRSWRTTSNGLESTAAEHSDIGLMLDEIGEIDAREAGNAIYMLGNGSGKTRARQDGTAKPTSTHKLITLTTGEKSLGEHMASGGFKAMAGHEVRMINIEANAGAGLGIFENIHLSTTAQHFADSFDIMSVEHSGNAGPEFVKYIIDNRKDCNDVINEINELFIEANNVSVEVGQVQRVAKRFALIAAAGEIATKAGITGWKECEALAAAGICFKQWRESWPITGGREHEDAIEQTRGFLQVNKARFIKDSYVPLNCAGFFQNSEYWLYPKVFSGELCGDIRPATVTKALMQSGFLVTEENSKKRSARRSPSNEKQQRFYVIRDSILGGNEDE